MRRIGNTPLSVFYDGVVYIFFITAHLYLHGRRVGGKFHMPEMIEEEKYAQAESDGVGDFQDSEAVGCFARHLCVYQGKKGSHISVGIKSHNRKRGSEKRYETDNRRFDAAKKQTAGRGFFICEDKVGLSQRSDRKIGFPAVDLFYQIHDRHDVSSRSVVGQIHNRKHPETVKDPGIAAGQFRYILQIYMGMKDTDILVNLKIQSVFHR